MMTKAFVLTVVLKKYVNTIMIFIPTTHFFHSFFFFFFFKRVLTIC